MKAFQSEPNKLHSISSSENIVSPRFHAVSFFFLKITFEISKIDKGTQCGHYLTFNVLSNYINILVQKHFPHKI